MNRRTKVTLDAGCVAVVGMMIPIGLILYSIGQHDRWVIGRLETFANYPYYEWKLIHDACADLVAKGEAFSLSRDEKGWDELPDVLKQVEPKWVWMKGSDVTLRCSGGHSRYLHIEYDGDTVPPQLELVAEWMYMGVVYPSDDQRTVGEKRLDTDW